jgi:hopanoid biosynthesis associated protein HpnK
MEQEHMSGPERYAVFTADDLGRSASVNRAVMESHDRGVVRAASIMAGGEAFEEAVEAARARPGLSVGLHLTLCDGRAVLRSSREAGLADARGFCPGSPARAGLVLWRGRCHLLGHLRAEVAAQFDRLQEAGINPTHVDGHHHLHMHPVVFPVLCSEAARRGVRWVRIAREPFLSVRQAEGWRGKGRFLAEGGVFSLLAMRASRVAVRNGLMSADEVYGLARSGRVTEEVLCGQLVRTRRPVVEFYAHPDTGGSGLVELRALTSLRLRDAVGQAGLRLAGYRELAWEAAARPVFWRKT